MSISIPRNTAHAAKLELRAQNSATINPIIQKAANDGCLSMGTLDDFASATGIPLACTTSPVVVFTPYRPVRNVKYHAPPYSAHQPDPRSVG